MTDSQNTKGLLVISRHGESEWNVLGKWTGWTDVGLTEKGATDAEEIGRTIPGDIQFDEVYTSVLKRTEETLQGIIRGLEKPALNELPKTAAQELNERDYGVYTGKNKWEVQQSVDEATFTGLRRGWDFPVEGGENLKQVYERVIPYFEAEILPKLQTGENILLVAHGNSIRALIKYLEGISDEDIADVEMKFGQVLVYRFEPGSNKPVDKATLQANIEQTKA
ncbi:MAG TPA: 2,3-bisphosphoglycerate-dependent phosphoglycerate mutase [Candidatus Saccharibacteria bacterium]|nr:2,3-bisphosphoglycerate-dependent phosphoglycerate mutase [Candidatus Saccharibacteria bacterium]